jgi:hypothetical protein
MNANIHNEKVVNISLTQEDLLQYSATGEMLHKHIETQAALNTPMPAFI